MPSKEKRQRQENEREIMECVKQNCLNAFHTPKKENSYQQAENWGTRDMDHKKTMVREASHHFWTALVSIVFSIVILSTKKQVLE
jgi:hypothetical protein